MLHDDLGDMMGGEGIFKGEEIYVYIQLIHFAIWQKLTFQLSCMESIRYNSSLYRSSFLLVVSFI